MLIVTFKQNTFLQVKSLTQIDCSLSIRFRQLLFVFD
jgi:hypothetical protein